MCSCNCYSNSGAEIKRLEARVEILEMSAMLSADILIANSNSPSSGDEPYGLLVRGMKKKLVHKATQHISKKVILSKRYVETYTSDDTEKYEAMLSKLLNVDCDKDLTEQLGMPIFKVLEL